MANGDPLEGVTYKATAQIDLIREVCRNILGLGAVSGILYMMYQFVMITAPDERMQIINLVVGFIGGFASGIGTWYFGGAMRSAMKGADTARKEMEAQYATKPVKSNGDDSNSPSAGS